MKKSKVIIGVVIILVVLIVWGLVGSSEAAKIGIDCDNGSAFCWKWHKNIIGDIGDAINQVFDK
jgi:hypothetical protein